MSTIDELMTEVKRLKNRIDRLTESIVLLALFIILIEYKII